jgi:tetratricopeptide (TPR) repeat protein
MNKRILIKLLGLGLLFSIASLNPYNCFASEAGVSAASPLFYQGNFAYKEGKYDIAVENYEKIVNSGFGSGNLYYNLGNSYFKKGELGKAVLSYEKATLFIPNDSDLKSNYQYVSSSLNLGPQSFGNWLEKLANRFFEEATIDFLTIFLSFIYLFITVFLICSLFFPSFRRNSKIIILVLVVLFVFSVVSLSSKITYLNNGAVVISREADVKFEPVEGATTYFKLSEGNKIEIIEKTENWYKIKRPDGKIGWIDKAALGLILESPKS